MADTQPTGRTEYVYIAARIDARDSQNLGDYSIGRRGCDSQPRAYYHYDSATGRLINRIALVHITKGSHIYTECLRAIGRLHAEEADRG